MKHIHVVVPDLFLPQGLAKSVCADLRLPALEKLLARSNVQALPAHSLEAWLCGTFGVPETAIAPVTLSADGHEPESGYWLRADPVHLRLSHDQMILQTNVSPTLEEAQQLCESLSRHFIEDGMHFFAPHLQRWYLRLDDDPHLTTHSVYQVEGRNSRAYMPQGAQALKWHSLLNEVQMALYGHPLYQSMESRGALPINSVWLWGGGRAVALNRPFGTVCGDCDLAMAFAQAANIPYADVFDVRQETGNTLYVWEGLSAALRRGDFHAWRASLGKFEQEGLALMLSSLADGKIDRITLDVLQEEKSCRYDLTRAMLWRMWKRARPLASYALV